MKRQDFNFDLPSELIAQYPLPNRSDSRLLVHSCNSKSYEDNLFKNIASFLMPGDLLVFNNSKVIPARVYGHKASGGKIELLIERIISDDEFLAHIKASKALKNGGVINVGNNWSIEIIEKIDSLYHCKLNGNVELMLDEIGHVPLPPYITRKDDKADLSRYQTIYALHKGSVAAPTAGLHFDELVMDELKAKGVKWAFATLHVGAGTFQPVRADNITDHKMHNEFFSVSDELCEAVNKTHVAGNRVIAVGTTALRSLESAAVNGELKACSRDTDIFIYPGYKFQICDGLLTNFHLPESTLLMLVSAFIGYEEMHNLYKMAIEYRYRFFSYGDACLLLREG